MLIIKNFYMACIWKFRIIVLNGWVKKLYWKFKIQNNNECQSQIVWDIGEQNIKGFIPLNAYKKKASKTKN